MSKTILAIGAHYDDCPYGIPGILLKAVRKNYRVVVLSIIGDYENWKPVRGRAQQMLDGTREICARFGTEIRFLDYASMRYDVNLETKRAVAEVVAEVQPDIAFMLWPDDTHADHEVASALSKVALRHGDRVLENPLQAFKRPSQIYMFDNGPRHTIGFEPDTFVDVTDEWPRAMDWLGQLMALVRGEKYDPTFRGSAQESKEALARYRGITCGVKYAEAVRSLTASPSDLF